MKTQKQREEQGKIIEDIFAEIEKMKIHQQKLHDLFKNGKNEETKQENRV